MVEDGGELRDTVAEIEEHAARTRDEKIAAGMLAPDHPMPYIAWDALSEAMASHCVVYLGHGHAGDDVENGSFRGLIAPEMRFGGQLKGLADASAQAAQRRRPRRHRDDAGGAPDRTVAGAGVVLRRQRRHRSSSRPRPRR